MVEITALKTFYVVDTSYLDELHKVPTKWTGEKNAEAKEKITTIIEENINPLFVTASVLFEFARHIAQVADGNKRRQLAKTFKEFIEKLISDNNGWNIYPSADKGILLRLADIETLANKFSESGAVQKFSLTDINIVITVEELGKKYPKYHH